MSDGLPDEGVLFVISGPSGVGKSTLIKDTIAQVPGLSFSVSATTRQARPGEVEGVDYLFVPPEQFEAWVEAEAFLEHATVYDRSYGTLREPTQRALASGRSLVLDIDVQGAAQVRRRWPGVVSVFVLPPSLVVLEQRLRGRDTDDEATVARRMAQAAHQLYGAADYDYLLVNEEVDTSRAVLRGIVLAETHRRDRRRRALSRVLSELAAGA
ncbi:MAG: guanylate kinase [Myxococcota bacterium]